MKPQKIKANKGDKFGALTIVDNYIKPLKKGTVRYYKCLCDCGNNFEIRRDHLIKLKYPNCGCISSKLRWDARAKNNTINPEHDGIKHIGETYGNLKILEKAKSQSITPTYICECICGNIKEIRFDHLKDGNTASCGCKRIEMLTEYGKKFYGEHAFNVVCNSYKHSAKTRGIYFELTKEEFREITSKNCHYCGILPSKIKSVKSGNGDYVYNGIDRVDSSIGYLKENCVPCCSMCNYMKRSYTSEDFLNHINRIYNFQKENNGSGVLTWA